MFISKTSQGKGSVGIEKALLQLNCHDDKVGEIQLF